MEALTLRAPECLHDDSAVAFALAVAAVGASTVVESWIRLRSMKEACGSQETPLVLPGLNSGGKRAQLHIAGILFARLLQ